MMHAATTYRDTAPIRREPPFPTEAPHPRCVEMAEAMREGADTFKRLIGAGFTAAEAAEFGAQAKELATTLSVREIEPRPDLLADMKIKAINAKPDFRPLPKGTADSQALFVAWGRYCSARQAFDLYPWDGQKERCVDELQAFFRATTAGSAVAAAVVHDVTLLLTGRLKRGLPQ